MGVHVAGVDGGLIYGVLLFRGRGCPKAFILLITFNYMYIAACVITPPNTGGSTEIRF